jgi:hypothetical protein
MPETSIPTTTGADQLKLARRSALRATLGSLLRWAPALALGPVIIAHLLFFGVRAAHLLGYPYPLDYGEGPLLSQVQVLRAGTPIWALYADPGAPPYAVVNYPPVYHLVSLAADALAGAAGCAARPEGAARCPLLAGRLVSLLATLAATLALWRLSASPDPDGGRGGSGDAETGRSPSDAALRLLVVLSFLAVPIVREWGAVMRVDMLGVCLGLWGLALVRRASQGHGAVAWAALPLALSLFVKPSLIAAPAAAVVWLLFRDSRMALRLAAGLALAGGAGLGLLQLASGGWFLMHVVAANANPIDRQLGAAFWDGQLEILWPLFLAGALAGALGLVAAWRGRRPLLLLPILYTLFGALVALGIGKVGAYLNYFLELYAGLVWLVAASVTTGRVPWPNIRGRQAAHHLMSLSLALLVAASLLRYYPLWSETYLKPYGLIEGQSPARVAFGSYGVWQDLAREQEVLGALGRVNRALVSEVEAAGAPIFTDLPGIAAQAGQLARLQAFEHRQLHDTGLWDQRPLLRDLANGRVPLVALDYLGNWLTPEMIAVITHRYAQDGSRGPYDLYRPVEPGERRELDLSLPAGLALRAVSLTPPGGERYSGGELVAVTLELAASAEASAADSGPCSRQAGACSVALRLLDGAGSAVAESELPLLYGALHPDDLAAGEAQHMQPLALPPTLAAGGYAIAGTLRADGVDLAPLVTIGRIEVGELSGRLLGERGYFVPAPLLEAWARAGGYDGPGDPLTPAVPFGGFTAQCFQRACFRVSGGAVERVPLGAIISLAETGVPAGEPRLEGAFRDYWEQSGGKELLGLPVTPEFARGDQIVQYTRYARLERPGAGGEVRLAMLGEEFLRLPGGVPYRWP